MSKAIEVRSNEIIPIANKLIKFRDRTKKRMMETGFRGVTAFHIIDQLIGYRILDILSVQRFTGKSFESANPAVLKLIEVGVLREITGRRRNRIFMCREGYGDSSRIASGALIGSNGGVPSIFRTRDSGIGPRPKDPLPGKVLSRLPGFRKSGGITSLVNPELPDRVILDYRGATLDIDD